MSNQDLPRWEIRYRPAGTDEYQTLIIVTESMITALKEAQQLLRELGSGPYYITAIAEIPAEEST